jgi:hypothetical protein
MIIKLIIWWLVGIVSMILSIIYQDKDNIKLGDFPIILGAGLFGPFLWIFMIIILVEKHKDFVIIKVKKDENTSDR